MRVLITRPKAQTAEFAEELRRVGVEVVFFPTIKIEPVDDTRCLDQALCHLECYTWLVLTSANAAEVVLRRMADLGLDRLPQALNVAAIGPKTAARLQNAGISPDFVPDQHVAEAILPGLGDLRDRWVLLPMADIANDTLPKAVQKGNGIAHVITVYHTIAAEPDPDGLAALRDGVDYITFTSGSTANHFFTLVQKAGLDPLHLPGGPKIACIGPKTAQSARKLGFQVDIIAEPHTTSGLVGAIQKHIYQRPN